MQISTVIKHHCIITSLVGSQPSASRQLITTTGDCPNMMTKPFPPSLYPTHSDNGIYFMNLVSGKKLLILGSQSTKQYIARALISSPMNDQTCPVKWETQEHIHWVSPCNK